jgi:lysophospholipase L1-like esterase
LSREVTLQYVARPNGGSFEVRHGADGALVTTLSTAAAQEELRTWQYQLPAGQSQYTLQPLGDGLVTILGQDNARADTGVRVHRAANGGWGVNNFLQRDWTFDDQLAELGTDLIMVWIGQNDQGESRSSYAAKLNQLVDRLNGAVPDAEVVLIGTYDQGSPNLPALVNAMDDVAATRGVGFINLLETAGDRAFYDANGYLDDGIHFSPAGGAYLGDFLADAFISNGASLVPEPSSLSIVVLAMATALGRRRRR